VENALLEATGDEEHHFAVISAPDRLRGEKLVALYDGPDLQPKAVLAAMTKAGIPNLWLPAERNLIRVDSVPLLASGKLDLCQARRLATKRGALPEQKS
jgi:acyl-[acyl-carrier-protein]-phospholipid O-acyltransferase/long-chain-fatty-acid--[acyl-carrier-protein] ligase